MYITQCTVLIKFENLSVHHFIQFAYTHGLPGGQWHRNACIHGWCWPQFVPADYTASLPQSL